MNIKNRLQKAASDAKEKRTAILMGEFNAILEKVTAKTYKSGAFGFEFIFALTDKGEARGRKIYDHIVVTSKDGNPVKFSDERLVRRLYNLGVDDKALETFEIPDSSDEKGGLPSLQGKSVVLSLERKINAETGESEQNLKKVVQAKTKTA